MANAPRNKILPHLEKRSPRYDDQAPRAAPDEGRRKIRRASAAAALIVALFAVYPLLNRQTAVTRRADGVAVVTPCDRMAANPTDTQRVAPGVADGQLDIPRARRACIDALKRQPQDGRTLYQIARIYFAAKEDQAGTTYLRQSADTGYAQGQYALGQFLMRSRPAGPNTCEPGQLWVKAARQRHLYAKLDLATAWHGGAFHDCGLDITESEISDMLKAAGELTETPQEQQDLNAARKTWGP